MKYIRIHAYEYTKRMFTNNLSHRDRTFEAEIYISKFWTKHGGDGKRWPLTPFPFLMPWSSCPPAIETPPRPFPAGPLMSWHKNASCSQIPPRASRASLPPRQCAMTRHQLSLLPCSAPPSCSLQPLLKLSLLSLRPLCSNLSQSIHFCWITKIRSLNLCVCFAFPPSVFTVCFSFSSPVFTFLIEMNFSFKSLFAIWLYHHSDSTIAFSLV